MLGYDILFFCFPWRWDQKSTFFLCWTIDYGRRLFENLNWVFRYCQLVNLIIQNNSHCVPQWCLYDRLPKA